MKKIILSSLLAGLLASSLVAENIETNTSATSVVEQVSTTSSVEDSSTTIPTASIPAPATNVGKIEDKKPEASNSLTYEKVKAWGIKKYDEAVIASKKAYNFIKTETIKAYQHYTASNEIKETMSK